MKEIGKAVLTIPVLTGNVDTEEVREAMETVSTSDVYSEKSWKKLIRKKERGI